MARKYTPRKIMSVEERCNRYKINENGCWIYQGYKSHDGYGVTEIGQKAFRMHRLAWEFWNKKKIPEGMTIDHICFQRDCINPHHLRLATVHENCSRRKNGNGRPVSMWCEKHRCPKVVTTWKEGQAKSVCKQCAHERYLAWKEKHPSYRRERYLAGKG